MVNVMHMQVFIKVDKPAAACDGVVNARQLREENEVEISWTVFYFNDNFEDNHIYGELSAS
jgi:hypothetical protein